MVHYIIHHGPHNGAGGTMRHAIHRMTSDYRCVGCGRTETDLYQSGASISGYDAVSPPIPYN